MMHKVINIKEVKVGNDLPFTLIAGPCQLETGEHAIMVASELAEMCAMENIDFIFKASFDKANRTNIKSSRGNEYVSGFVDSYSRFTMVFPIKTKDTAISTIDKMVQYTSNVDTVKKLMSDLGGEFVSKELIDYY